MPTLSKITLIVAIGLYICLAFILSETVLFNQGPDEETNLAYARFIVERGRLPITYAERELVGKDANWPALYHLIVAQIGRWMDAQVDGPPHIKIFWDSFRYRVIDAGQAWYYLYTEDQLRPFFGRILILHIGRWLAIAFGAINLGLVYFVIREVTPKREYLALAGAALLAFWPVYVFMSGVMNEDTMTAAMATLYLWLLILIVKQPDRWWPYLAIGAVLGLSVTIKYNTIVLPLEIIVVFSVLARRQNYSWRWAAQRILLVGVVSVLAAGWWFGWNFWHLNKVEEYGWLIGLLTPIFTGGPDITLSRLGYYLSGGQIGLAERPPEREAGTFLAWLRTTFLTFWTESIHDFFNLSPYSYIGVAILIGLVLFGLWRLWRNRPAARSWLLLLIFHVGVFCILPLFRFLSTRRIGETAQGRHILIPAGAAIMTLMVWGIAAALPKKWHKWAFALIVAGFAVWSGLMTHRVATSAPPPVPLRTVPQAAAWLPHQLNSPLGESIELAGYEITPQPAAGLLRINLAWRSVAYVNQNYLFSLTVTDSGGRVMTHWLGYTGQARLPTLAWDPGDVVFDRLTLPLIDAPSGDYLVKIKLLDEINGSLIGQSPDLPFTLKSDAVAIEQAPLPIRQAEQADFILWGAAGPLEGPLPTFRYPASIAVFTADTDSVRLVDPAGITHSPRLSEANFHLFIIQPAWPSGRYQLELTPEGEAVPLRVENWWKRHFVPPEPIETPLEANFANQLKLLGYTLPRQTVQAGEAFPITLYWQAMADKPPEAHFIQFNHLVDGSGNLYGGYDRIPLEYYSTLLWAADEVIVDGYAVPVATDAPPGDYYLNVGYYLPMGESYVNLPLVENNQPTDIHSVVIGPIKVIE